MRRLTINLWSLSLVYFAFPAAAVNFQTAGPIEPSASSDGLNKFDQAPRVATDAAGHWVAVWETSEFGGVYPDDLNVAVSRSSDNGATWTPPSHVVANENIDDAMPCLATDGNGTWVCAYTSRSLNTPYHRAVQTRKSTDNGATWSAPSDANPNDPVNELSLPYNYTPSIAADGAGHWVLVWDTTYTQLSDPNPISFDNDIAVSTSTNGSDWTEPTRVNSQSTTDAEGIRDVQPKVACDRNGVWVCVWRSNYKYTDPFYGDDEIYFARSTNNGGTWSAQAVLNAEFNSEAESDDHPNVASDGNGTWMITWEAPSIHFGVDRIWTSISTDDGTTWGARKRISDEPALGDSGAPDVASGGNGKWMVVWHRHLNQKTHPDFDIAKSETSDDGDHWSAVANLNSNATADLGDDRDPAIASDGAGHWVVVWWTEDTVNADQDVWRAISGAGGGGSLTLTVPNGGEKWKIDKKYTIEWDSSGDSGANVKLELLQNNSVVETINGSTPNDGKQKWKLPNSLTPGKGYKVRVTSKSDGSIKDASDGSFRVKSAK